jgi:NADP-dependent 3-hydroxy acid dehydrogenase YdfG
MSGRTSRRSPPELPVRMVGEVADHRILDVNVMGYVHGARAALPQLREQGKGMLINVRHPASDGLRL